MTDSPKGYIDGGITTDLTVNTPLSTNASNGYIRDRSVLDITVSGLSRLQRWMLERAAMNRAAEQRNDPSRGADLYYAEVLAGFYGFQSHYSIRGNPGSHHFRPHEIGRGKYNAACAAISRAAKRLAERGLVCMMYA